MTEKTCPACGNGLDDNGAYFWCCGCCQRFTSEGKALDRPAQGAGIFSISYEMLAQALALPKGVEIVGVRDEGWSRSLEVAVRGPGLPESRPGQRMAQVTAISTLSEGRVVSVEFVPVEDPAERELADLRAEVARLRALVQDDGR